MWVSQEKVRYNAPSSNLINTLLCGYFRGKLSGWPGGKSGLLLSTVNNLHFRLSEKNNCKWSHYKEMVDILTLHKFNRLKVFY